MRVLQILPSLHPAFGGPVTSARAVTEAYHRFADVDTLTVASRQATDWVAGRSVIAYRGFRVPFLTPHVATVSPGILREARRRAPDYELVHLHCNRSASMLPVGWAMAHDDHLPPLIVQSHGMLDPWTGPKRVVDAVFTRRILEAAAVVLTLSEAESARLNARYGDLPLRVFHNAVPRADAAGDVVLETRTTISGATGEPPVLLFCARLHPRKGLLTFLAACRLLVADGRRLRIVVAGEDEGARSRAEKYSKDSGMAVTFTGGLDSRGVREVMAGATVLVHSAPHEPFGMVMLEAFARRLPVVSAPTSELAPLFRSRRAATLPDAESPEAYARAIASLLDDDELRARQVRNAVDLVHRDFSVDGLERNLREVSAVALAASRR